VRRIVIGARSTHFCSWCQRLPAGDRAGAAKILRGMEPRPERRSPARADGEPAAPAAPLRRGPRWTEIGGLDGAVGRAGSSRRAAAVSPAERARRAEATRAAAATRRAKARAVRDAGAGDAAKGGA
jgi:hypothetical protein